MIYEFIKGKWYLTLFLLLFPIVYGWSDIILLRVMVISWGLCSFMYFHEDWVLNKLNGGL